MESADIVTNGLLAIIAGLGALCTWFLSRMVNKFDELERCVEQLAIDLSVFKAKVSTLFGMELDEEGEKLPDLKPVTKRR